jgi:hypothetical protein
MITKLAKWWMKKQGYSITEKDVAKYTCTKYEYDVKMVVVTTSISELDVDRVPIEYIENELVHKLIRSLRQYVTIYSCKDYRTFNVNYEAIIRLAVLRK